MNCYEHVFVDDGPGAGKVKLQNLDVSEGPIVSLRLMHHSDRLTCGLAMPSLLCSAVGNHVKRIDIQHGSAAIPAGSDRLVANPLDPHILCCVGDLLRLGVIASMSPNCACFVPWRAHQVKSYSLHLCLKESVLG